MDLGRIKYLQQEVKNESISMMELVEIQEAFAALVASGAELRDDPDNALAKDQLEELEAHAPTAERAIYDWFVAKFGVDYANDLGWSTRDLAREINEISVIPGGEEGRLGVLLNETDY